MKKLLLPFFIIGTIAMIIVMSKTGSTLKTASTPLGILNLEFAYDTAHVNKTINAWRASSTNVINNIAVAKANTYWDFLFIFFYAGLLFLWSKQLSTIYKEGTGFNKAGKTIGYIALVAGGLDVIENCCMFQSLNDNLQNALALITCICAAVKFTLIVIPFFYILLSLPLSVYAKIRNK